MTEEHKEDQHDHTDVGGEEANHHGKLDLDEYELPGCIDMGSQLQPISLLQRTLFRIILTGGSR